MSELILYKQQEIIKLKNEYNINIKNLTIKFNTDTDNLKKQKNMSPLYKARRLAKITEEYKNILNKLYINLLDDIIYINKLTKIPGIIPNNKALLIGINYYETNYQLNGCINDTNELKQLLLQKYNFLEENIIQLTDDPSNNNQELLPKKENIINNLKNILINSKAGDILFFGYSGHGSYILDRNGDENDGYDSILIPSDAIIDYNNIIIDDELKDIIDLYLKEDVKLFALLDCCFSGTAMDLKYNYYDTDNANNITINLNETITKGQVIMISGCKDNQTSSDAIFYDSSNNTIYAGALTHSFLKSLKDNNYSISYKKLLENMRKFLKINGYTQIPQLSTGKTINVDDNFSKYIKGNAKFQ